MEEQLLLTKNDEKLAGKSPNRTNTKKKFKLPLKIIHDDQRLTINLIENQIENEHTENSDKNTSSHNEIKQVNIYPYNKSTFTNVSTKIENEESKQLCKKTWQTSNLFNFFRKNSNSISCGHQNNSNRYSNIVSIIKETFEEKNSELGDVFVMPLLKLSDYRSDYVDNKLGLSSPVKVNVDSKKKNEETKQGRSQAPNPPLRSDSISASFSHKDNFKTSLNDIIRLVKKRNSSVSASGSGGSGQTNKLDALKNEIDKTMNEINKFKRKVKIQKASKFMVNMGVNTDISMCNAHFKVNYDDSSSCSNEEEDFSSFSSNPIKNSYLTCFKPSLRTVRDINCNKSSSFSESFASGFHKYPTKLSNTNSKTRAFKPVKGSFSTKPNNNSNNSNPYKGYLNKKEHTLYNVYCKKSGYPIEMDDQEDESILLDERSNTVFKKIFQRQATDLFNGFEDESEYTNDKYIRCDGETNSDDTSKSFSLTDLSEAKCSYEPLKHQKLFDFDKVNTFKTIIEPPTSNDEDAYNTQTRLSNKNNTKQHNGNYLENTAYRPFTVPKKKDTEDVKLKIIPLNPNSALNNHHSMLMMMMKNSKKNPITSFSFISNDTYFANEPIGKKVTKLECNHKRVHHMPRSNVKSSNHNKNGHFPNYYSKSASFNLHTPINKSSLPALNYFKQDNWSMNSLNETRRMRSEGSSTSINFRDALSRYELRLSKIDSDESGSGKKNQLQPSTSRKSNKFKMPNMIRSPNVVEIDSPSEKKYRSKTSKGNMKIPDFKSVIIFIYFFFILIYLKFSSPSLSVNEFELKIFLYLRCQNE